MSDLPNCPQCNSEYTYPDGNMYVCPECAHEWLPGSSVADETDDTRVIVDANGTALSDGDSVTVIKDLKVKGTSSVVKIGHEKYSASTEWHLRVRRSTDCANAG